MRRLLRLRPPRGLRRRRGARGVPVSGPSRPPAWIRYRPRFMNTVVTGFPPRVPPGVNATRPPPAGRLPRRSRSRSPASRPGASAASSAATPWACHPGPRPAARAPRRRRPAAGAVPVRRPRRRARPGRPVPTRGRRPCPLDALAEVDGRDESPVDPRGRRRPTAPPSAGRTAASPRPASTPSRPVAPFPEARRPPWARPRPACSTRWPRRPRRRRGSTRYALDCVQLRARRRPRGRRHRRPPGPRSTAASPSPGTATSWSGGRRCSPCTGLPRDRPGGGRPDRAPTSCSAPAPGPCSWRSRRAAVPRGRPGRPRPGTPPARLRSTPATPAFLGPALDRLPGGGEHERAGHPRPERPVAVRAREGQARPTELVLSRSGYAGQPVRLGDDREFLRGRSGSGLPGVELAGAAAPVVCRDGTRVYAWQPLSGGRGGRAVRRHRASRLGLGSRRARPTTRRSPPGRPRPRRRRPVGPARTNPVRRRPRDPDPRCRRPTGGRHRTNSGSRRRRGGRPDWPA